MTAASNPEYLAVINIRLESGSSPIVHEIFN